MACYKNKEDAAAGKTPKSITSFSYVKRALLLLPLPVALHPLSCCSCCCCCYYSARLRYQYCLPLLL